MARSSDNPFSHKNSPFEYPLVSRLRRLRGRLVLLAFCSVVLGVVLAFRFSRSDLLSEGPLHSKHAFLTDNCQACHVPPVGGGHATMTDNCMRCHDHADGKGFVANPQPHGNRALVDALTADRKAKPDAQVRSGFAALVNALPGGRMHQGAHAAIACTACHQEHRGADGNLIRLTNATCQACHQNVFESFAHGHPEFTALARRERSLKFDHARHYGSLFAKNAKGKERIDREGCVACHRLPDTVEDYARSVHPVETSCLPCHQKDLYSACVTVLASQPGKDAKAPLVPQAGAFAAFALSLADPAKRPDLARIHDDGVLSALLPGMPLLSGVGEEPLAVMRTGKNGVDGVHTRLRPETWTAGRFKDDDADAEEHADKPTVLVYRTSPHADRAVVESTAWLAGLERRLRADNRLPSDWTKRSLDLLVEIGVNCPKNETDSAGCSKCHYAGVTANGVVADFARQRPALHFTRPFSHFVHWAERQHVGGTATAHGPDDCAACHASVKAPEGEAKNDPRWQDLRVHRRGHDWKTLGIADCRTCHKPDTVRQDCTTCHQYHQGAAVAAGR